MKRYGIPCRKPSISPQETAVGHGCIDSIRKKEENETPPFLQPAERMRRHKEKSYGNSAMFSVLPMVGGQGGEAKRDLASSSFFSSRTRLLKT
ncbi:hypothetical protein GWI33_007980 [Rhynchophorus ferrugineus]|uniref:Uncharacterized protein n=1 Tax=Rhynchophorus ferrugineus TaxID=354439 RepID=A0A834IJ25_RHYFE|nr:hypothetical protein GWI33_007980 [Rhynchophorus ferrugineus]